MSVTFPGFNVRRRTQRAETNPADVTTVFSILPKDITEVKHTLDPSTYKIPRGTPEKPSALVVKPASWWKDIDPDQPLIEIPTSSIVVAKSIVNDYCNGILMCDMGEAMPGLFYIPGNISVKDLQTKPEYKTYLDVAIKKQETWFTNMVRLADSLWARANGNPLAIPEDARLAAKMLQILDKPWAMDFKLEHLQACPACGTMRNSNFPVCANCKSVIDTKRFTELGLKFAS